MVSDEPKHTSVEESEEDVPICYLCRARVDSLARFFLWVSGGDDPDRIVLAEDGAISSFSSEASARAVAASTGYTVSDDEPAAYDIDEIEAWSKSEAQGVDCRSLLGLWNLATDLPNRGEFFIAVDKRANDLYEKLFAGCNTLARNGRAIHSVVERRRSTLTEATDARCGFQSGFRSGESNRVRHSDSVSRAGLVVSPVSQRFINHATIVCITTLRQDAHWLDSGRSAIPL